MMVIATFVAALLAAGVNPRAAAAVDTPASVFSPGPGARAQAITANQPFADAPPPLLPPSVPGDPDAAPIAAHAGAPDDIIVTAGSHAPHGDPLQHLNAQAFAATQVVDRAFIGPLASVYEHGLPEPVRSGLSNFLYNLREPVVFINFLIQIKPGKGAETLGRFALNSTLGVGGLFDVAKRRPFRLPRRPNGFADSLGFYGVKPGPFLFVPLIGPTTLRDLVGDGVDRLVVPLLAVAPFNRAAYTIPAAVVSTLDHRVAFDAERKVLASSNPYAARRTFYLQDRQAEIDALRGQRGRMESPRRDQAPDAAPAPVAKLTE